MVRPLPLPGGGEDDTPHEWPLGTLGDFAKIAGETISPGATPAEVFAHYSLPQFDATRTPAIEPGDAIKSNKVLIAKGVVLVSKLNPRFPRIWAIDDNRQERMICSTEFVPLRPINAEWLYWLAAALSSNTFQQYLAGYANGTSTSHQRVKPLDVVAFPLRTPPHALLSAAAPHFQFLGQQAETLRHSNTRLRAARDLLLPKLISGEIDVSAAPAPDDVARDAA